MLIASGTTLVLFTWALCAGALVSLGLLPALATTFPADRGRASTARVMRLAMWWGLLVATVFAYLVNLWLPLHSGATATIGIGLLLATGLPGWWLLRRRGWHFGKARRSVTLGALWLALGLAVVYLAVAVLGPVTNYDSGLYHLGAVKYSADYPTIPGLANLFFALGYGTAEFPLAALLGNGPWQGEGFRLLNGLLLALAVVDLWLRSRERRLGPGFFVLLAGILASFVPMVALSDYWVTSPTQDSAVFILTVVATAYLSDAVRGKGGWLSTGTVVGVLGIQLVLLRTTMVAFSAAAILVVIALAVRRRPRNARLIASTATFAGAGVLALIAATARDVLLSGWFLYPLSLIAFDVPWRAADPTPERVATLGFHRDPSDLWASAEGWSWVSPWLAERVRQWETYEFIALVSLAVLLLIVARRNRRATGSWRGVALAMLPSVLASVVWWGFTPPSYRFAWGPLFTIATVPLGWTLWRLASDPVASAATRARWLVFAVVTTAVPIALVTAFSAVARLDTQAMTASRTWDLGVAIPYVVAPVIDVPVRLVDTAAGLTLLQPTASDQCWDNFHLCTPWPNPALRLRGETLSEGLLP